MKEDKEQLIEAYFSRELSAEEQERFEWLLAHDADFSEGFDFEKEIRDTVVYNERQQLKARFRTLDGRTIRPVRKLTHWYAAAGILILLGVGWFLFKPQQPAVDMSALYAQYMEPYPNVLAPKVRGELDVDQIMADAMTRYDQRAYAEAATLFEELYMELPGSHVALYLAICRLQLDQPEQAIELLEAEGWKDARISPAVLDWYKGLAYLKIGNQERALQYIKQVVASKSNLASRAKKLLQQLEALE